MHQCEEFRERITEHIIDREDLVGNAEFQEELLLCSACSEFYVESREMIEALSAVDLSISERQWHGIEHRLRIVDEVWRHSPPRRGGVAPRSASPIGRSLKEGAGVVSSAKPSGRSDHPVCAFGAASPPLRGGEWRRVVPPLLAAAAMLLLTIGFYRLATPLVKLERPATSAAPAAYVDPSVSLDPVTVDFLEESELLLRNVMKITPNDMDDLADAQKVANGQLADIEQRKEAAADAPPVVGVMDTYETILRDIRNVDERSATEDIADIQSRIRKNGLIANIKAFQPVATPVSFGVR
jgi:hypothetical protein